MDTLLPPADPPENSSGGFAIVLGSTQLAAVLVVAFFAVGIFCSLSYIAGRSTIRPASVSAAAPVHVAATPPKTLSVVPLPCPSTPPTQTSESEPKVPEWKNVPPVPGALYYQVMSVEPGVAVVFARGLHAAGLEAIAAPGSGPGVQRVLVGPVTDQSMRAVRAKLESLGMHPFVKRLTENPPAAVPSPNK